MLRIAESLAAGIEALVYTHAWRAAARPMRWGITVISSGGKSGRKSSGIVWIKVCKYAIIYIVV